MSLIEPKIEQNLAATFAGLPEEEKVQAANPLPIGGAHRQGRGVNFVLFSRHALYDLFDPGKEPSTQGQIGFRLEPRSSAIFLSDGGEVLCDN